MATDHAVTSLKFHVVLATWKRQGVFSAEAAKAIVANWRDQQARLRVVFDKFSFLPDHVHIAVEVHPTVSPTLLVTKLMNASQEFAFENFPENVIRAKAERLWQPSAYIGSFGDLTTAAMKSYIDRWC
ncbi:MAG: IS200/IS605 family transposase [Pirellulaceae bacterium]|nr:IS200/IS605 family transposase [Pirellulaceae bacterium]